MTGPVAGVILAAGASNRMGRNKLLLRFEGESVLRRAARCALEAELDPVIVVLGHAAEAARRELDGLACRAVVNPDHEQGQTSSFHAGIAAVPVTVAAAVIILADMPFVTAVMLEALVRRFREGGAALVLSDYAGVTAPPTLYGRALFAEILATSGENAGKQMVKAHRAEAATLSWPADALSDLDEPGDYDRALHRPRGA